MRQAIILTNDGLAYWHIYMSLGLNELSIFVGMRKETYGLAFGSR